MEKQTVLVLDFGGQYNQLIARRVRELNVYCELVPYSISKEDIQKKNPIGMILTGGPSSIYERNAPILKKEVLEMGIPVLGICYGAQVITALLGGKVSSGAKEYGRRALTVYDSLLFEGLPRSFHCWMSHSDYIEQIAPGFLVNCITDSCPVGGIEHPGKQLYGVQFHPEVVHTEQGNAIIRNFLYRICGAKGDWTMKNFVSETVQNLQKKLKGKKTLCALSGGVDSAVAAAMIHRACPDLICVFVDHGLLRKNESEEVMRVFSDQQHMHVIRVDASSRFLQLLKGAEEPERKRKIIGEEFIRVFEQQSKALGAVDYLVQGTIYPDVIESGVGPSAVIKSHHNVGGLPSVVDFEEIIEPLRDLFKDEVRRCGLELGLPESIVMRQPFPGPGLAIRIIGEVTGEKLEILREADYIYREEIAAAGLDREIWQYFAVLTGMRSVGVMGDARTYDYCIALRAVTSIDGMTADWARIPFDVLEAISNRIVNEVRHVNRVVYDVTSKPPATIEWE